MPLASASVLHCINGARTRQDPFKLLFWTNRLPSLLFPEGPGSPTEGPAGLPVMVLNFETSPFVPTIICWDMYWVQFRRVLSGISNKWPADWYIHFIFAKCSPKFVYAFCANQINWHHEVSCTPIREATVKNGSTIWHWGCKETGLLLCSWPEH